jgi:NADH-quinone oxidoreductase subunit L
MVHESSHTAATILTQVEISHLYLIPLFPLLGSLLAFVIGKQRKALAGVIATLAAAASFAVTVSLFQGLPEQSAYVQNLFSWISVDTFHASFSFTFDRLTAVMCLVITGIGSLIHLYSTSYMEEDESVHRFFSYLNLFLFSMLLLVLGSNILVMFVGWEGVGLCSYLLIGFWFKNSSYASAGRKAFVVNRIGDAGVLLGTFLLFYHFGTIDFAALNEAIPRAIATNPALQAVLMLAALGFFVGATGKSAQLPLFVWLPDAMAGPTPVSALIHAATMVTAGVYMMARMHTLFDAAPFVQAIIVVVATLTAFVAAFTAITQNDIKKVLAYSTVSQLGFMFMAAGAGMYWIALFHVVTHAFFKACLFLGAGSVIHGCHHEQDMRQMGGLWKKMPITFITYLISTIAIAGIAPLSGYFSKHAILQALADFQNVHIAEYIPLLILVAKTTAFMTAFYMARSVAMTFFGSYRGHAHPHESPLRMTLPLIVLAGLATIGGYLPLQEYLAPVLGHHIHDHHEPFMQSLIGSWTGIVGVTLGLVLYLVVPALPRIIGTLAFPLTKLSQHKFYLDELYGVFIVRPLERIAAIFFTFFDQGLIDGAVNTSGAMMEVGGEVLRTTQSGQIRHYALFIFVGTIVLTAVYLIY